MLCLQTFGDLVTCGDPSRDTMEASLKTFTRSPHTHTVRNPFHNIRTGRPNSEVRHDYFLASL